MIDLHHRLTDKDTPGNCGYCLNAREADAEIFRLKHNEANAGAAIHQAALLSAANMTLTARIACLNGWVDWDCGRVEAMTDQWGVYAQQEMTYG